MGFSLGGILGGIANPVGMIANAGLGLLNGGFEYLSSEKDRQAANDQANADRALQEVWANKNFDFQNDFARHGLRWRVDDAMDAGLHPLAALGMNPTGGSPVQVFGSGGGSSGSSAGNSYRALSNMGQNVLRAINAGSTGDERMLMAARIDSERANADLARAQAAEAIKRTAFIGGEPPIPSAYVNYRMSDGSMQSGYSGEYAASMMSRPLSMWAEDISEIFGGMNSRELMRRMGSSVKMGLNPWRRN